MYLISFVLRYSVKNIFVFYEKSLLRYCHITLEEKQDTKVQGFLGVKEGMLWNFLTVRAAIPIPTIPMSWSLTLMMRSISSMQFCVGKEEVRNNSWWYV